MNSRQPAASRRWVSLPRAWALPLLLAAACSDDTPERERDAGDVTAEDGAVEDAQGLPDAAVDAGDDAGHDAEPPRASFRPEHREPSDALIAQLQVPEGFQVGVFARGLGHARMLAVHGSFFYLTRPQSGDVLRLADGDGDGLAEAPSAVASGLMGVHGIAFHADQVYLATPTTVYRAQVLPDGSFATPEVIIEDLPDGGQHPNRTLLVGPDQKLYISVGSSCDACMESNMEHATMLRAELDGSARTVLAKGLRNTLGFAFHPTSGQLWGMDQGSDWRGDDLPPEELNQIASGADYGWPYCFADRQVDPIIQEPPMGSKQSYCAATQPPQLVAQAHGSPIGFIFYTGNQLPESYRGSAFVTWRGSWNRFPPTGYGVGRVVFEGDTPRAFEPFLSGFLIEQGSAQFGRPAGLVMAPDGSLMFSDDEGGVIYRVRYTAPAGG